MSPQGPRLLHRGSFSAVHGPSSLCVDLVNYLGCQGPTTAYPQRGEDRGGLRGGCTGVGCVCEKKGLSRSNQGQNRAIYRLFLVCLSGMKHRDVLFHGRTDTFWHLQLSKVDKNKTDNRVGKSTKGEKKAVTIIQNIHHSFFGRLSLYKWVTNGKFDCVVFDAFFRFVYVIFFLVPGGQRRPVRVLQGTGLCGMHRGCSGLSVLQPVRRTDCTPVASLLSPVCFDTLDAVSFNNTSFTYTTQLTPPPTTSFPIPFCYMFPEALKSLSVLYLTFFLFFLFKM